MDFEKILIYSWIETVFLIFNMFLCIFLFIQNYVI